MLSIPDGNYTFDNVGGLRYSQDLLKKLYKKYGNNKFLVALTPPCDYQIQKQWPSLPFINVNLKDSKTTTKRNWLGYINLKYSDIDFSEIIKTGIPVNCTAKIYKDKEDYFLTLSFDESYAALELYTIHDEKQLDFLKVVHKRNPDHPRMTVDLIFNKDHFDICRKDLIIGKLSKPKSQQLKNHLGGAKIAYAYIVLSYFDYESKYTKLVVAADKLRDLIEH